MFNYSLDFSRLNADMLPPHHRKTRLKDLLFVLVSQVKFIYNLFASSSGLIEKMRDRVSFTGQTISLEYLLCREFCGGLALIHIEDSVKLIRTFLTNETETHPLYMANDNEVIVGYLPVYLFNDDEYNATSDFIVYVDPLVTFKTADMKAIINYYKPAGKIYEIKLIQ